MKTSPSDIILAARKKKMLSQASFSKEFLNIKQPQLSKYESNKSKIPADIIILCQNILADDSLDISARDLSERIFNEFDGGSKLQARLVLNNLLNLLTHPKP